MDAFLTKLSHQATSYAIRSCIALTSSYVIQKGSKLLKTVDDDPLRIELIALQKRLARKIEFVTPILENIEFRYTRGDSALEAVVRISRELREDIDALAKRLEAATVLEPSRHENESRSARRHAELQDIVADIKELIVNIDDAIPLINLWVSAVGSVQTQASSFSPSRLLQASMLVNVGDSQYILNPTQPMQIGPDFTLSLYMLFRGHASQDAGPYGIEDGQRKPTWQEVIHKARVRLYRVPPDIDYPSNQRLEHQNSQVAYTYRLQIVEDLDDGRVHTLEDGNVEIGSYDSVPLAGIREQLPVGQISKMFYADVGRILNINNEDGASSNPVLLLKRDVQSVPPTSIYGDTAERANQRHEIGLVEDVDGHSIVSDATLSESDPQDDIDRQLREESQLPETTQQTQQTESQAREVAQRAPTLAQPSKQWTIPPNLDPEWMALEVFDIEDDTESSEDEDDPTSEKEDHPSSTRPPKPRPSFRSSVDNNLVTQLQRMSLASTHPSSLPSSRPSSRGCSPTPNNQRPQHPEQTSSSVIISNPHLTQSQHLSAPLSPSLVERSPFAAIKTSLSILEMLLRLTSLQEFEQMTHLAIPDHVLKFYLDESASSSGLHGQERWAARAEAARKVGFDPYADAAM
ncbi:RanGTP-binding protein-domain-containing protein [Pseudomassariella vexata]|uniref:RanGTP-binding protein-domain-containing protein n=1 Tax=Pseudomassariella vexata TaxID=1141098 RepID=A0A1Y2DVI3_9PEZI|nr:RanGTP-binding protein-domain-containing protein [Pseudomassariella vexata]ORY62655.1 RanGTP-binding protein-domain-containing protein [Pseudomassariella vexata]